MWTSLKWQLLEITLFLYRKLKLLHSKTSALHPPAYKFLNYIVICIYMVYMFFPPKWFQIILQSILRSVLLQPSQMLTKNSYKKEFTTLFLCYRHTIIEIRYHYSLSIVQKKILSDLPQIIHQAVVQLGMDFLDFFIPHSSNTSSIAWWGHIL